MKILIQRVSQASVEVAGQLVSEIAHGLLIFLGVTHGDTNNEAEWLAKKLVGLRIFKDENGKTNKSITELQGEILCISQFTLYADCAEGRRPSFTQAAAPALANDLYREFMRQIEQKGIPVKGGVFGAEMQVSLINDGPFTLFLEKKSED